MNGFAFFAFLITVLASAILGVLVDRFLNNFLPEHPTLKHLVAIGAGILILAILLTILPIISQNEPQITQATSTIQIPVNTPISPLTPLSNATETMLLDHTEKATATRTEPPSTTSTKEPTLTPSEEPTITPSQTPTLLPTDTPTSTRFPTNTPTQLPLSSFGPEHFFLLNSSVSNVLSQIGEPVEIKNSVIMEGLSSAQIDEFLEGQRKTGYYQKFQVTEFNADCVFREIFVTLEIFETTDAAEAYFRLIELTSSPLIFEYSSTLGEYAALYYDIADAITDFPSWPSLSPDYNVLSLGQSVVAVSNIGDGRQDTQILTNRYLEVTRVFYFFEVSAFQTSIMRLIFLQKEALTEVYVISRGTNDLGEECFSATESLAIELAMQVDENLENIAAR